jgi:integrase
VLVDGDGQADLAACRAAGTAVPTRAVKAVQARLGHASASETLDTYSHLWPDPEDRTRQAVDSVLGAVRDRRGSAASS